jgi:hypothetical protein
VAIIANSIDDRGGPLLALTLEAVPASRALRIWRLHKD